MSDEETVQEVAKPEICQITKAGPTNVYSIHLQSFKLSAKELNKIAMSDLNSIPGTPKQKNGIEIV
jgi:hypothetical protein